LTGVWHSAKWKQTLDQEDRRGDTLFSMSPETAAELSLDEWFALPEDDPGELVDGHLVEEEAPDYLHEILVAFLVQALRNWI